jgi:hypothetical protein
MLAWCLAYLSGIDYIAPYECYVALNLLRESLNIIKYIEYTEIRSSDPDLCNRSAFKMFQEVNMMLGRTSNLSSYRNHNIMVGAVFGIYT